jgi:hypothetical protein
MKALLLISLNTCWIKVAPISIEHGDRILWPILKDWINGLIEELFYVYKSLQSPLGYQTLQST